MSLRPTLQVLTDEDKMPFGKAHKGVRMEDVPASYLHWVWYNCPTGNADLQAVRDYIFRTMDALKEENKDLIWNENL